MKKFLILLGVLNLALIINAQTTAPTIQWQRCYGGTFHDHASSIQQTKDGGYIVSGYSSSNNGDLSGIHNNINQYDYWILKIDSVGIIQWQKCLGGSYQDMAYFIQQTYDYGFIVAGTTTSHDGDVSGNHDTIGNPDFWVIKLDSSSNIQWKKCLGGSYGDEAYTVQQTIDSGYIVAGYSDSNDGDVSGNHGWDDAWIVKLDTGGNIQWQKCFGGSNSESLRSIQQTNDGGYIAAGLTSSIDGDVDLLNHDTTGQTPDCFIIKIDSIGNLQWIKCLGGSTFDAANSIIQSNDGGYIFAGVTTSIDGDVTGNHGGFYIGDYWVVKLDTSGNIQWQKCLGGTNPDQAISIQQTNDGGYVVAGVTQSNNGDVSGFHMIGSVYYEDSWIVKLDSTGNIQWQKCLGGTKDDFANSIIQTNNGGYIVAGVTESNDGDVSGNHDTTGSWEDLWIVKLGFTTGIKNQILKSDVSIYPNPSNGNFAVNVPIDAKYIEISNSLGQKLEKRHVVNQTELNFIIKENGVYFVQIFTNKKIITKKIIVAN